jgi:hypothetical protein
MDVVVTQPVPNNNPTAGGGCGCLPWVIMLVVVFLIIGACSGVSSSGSGSGDNGGYSGTYHDDSNGNPVPDDCAEWANSPDNPITSSDGVEVGQALCEGYG